MAKTRWLTADEQRVWRTFVQASQLLLGQLDRELQRDARIPLAYYEVLVHLSEAPARRLRMSDLAETSLSSRSRTSHAVARLEAAGWIRRERSCSDRRGLVAVLTPQGLDALREAAPGHVEAVRTHLFDRLTSAQIEALRTICEAIAAPLMPPPDPAQEPPQESPQRTR